jgi:hypothetical protein
LFTILLVNWVVLGLGWVGLASLVWLAELGRVGQVGKGWLNRVGSLVGLAEM